MTIDIEPDEPHNEISMDDLHAIKSKLKKGVNMEELLARLQRQENVPKRTSRAQKDLAKLVDADQLIEMLFDGPSRPTKRTIWNWTRQGLIPVIRVGVSIFFDPVAVKAALAKGKPKLARRKHQ